MDTSLMKDALGFAGAVVMAVPFFCDQSARQRLKRSKELKAVFTPFVKALSAAEAAHTDHVLAASKGDVVLMLVGLCLLASSFALSFIAGLSR
jgi:hypothetical protein